MLKYAVVAAVLMISATPALAGDGRAEVRGGIAWAGGGSEATGGIAAGYDFDLSEVNEVGSAFVGVEVSADRILVDGAPITFGGSVRFGFRGDEKSRFYAVGGYTIDDEGDDAFHMGAGYEHNFSSSIYGKVEYRHFLISNLSDVDSAVIGIGMRF